ncbi:ribonuclease HII [Succinimonas sp.]|uniref:ribonuclease HII n=1 Tax=Succinimonas sp. TaxID=1936151 RepID=UPI00386B7B54
MNNKEQKTQEAAFRYPEIPGIRIFAGTDEAGRGPLVGNVVAGAVILDPARPIAGLRDSKKLSEKKREALFTEITENALAFGIGECTPAEIDSLNILWAAMLAMERAVQALKVKPDFVLVDGNRLPRNLSIPAQAVVKGDALVPEISAASILAKVTRDRELRELDARYPEYGFARHKGYPTAEHLARIRELGVLSCYRKSFRPVAEILAARDGKFSDDILLRGREAELF